MHRIYAPYSISSKTYAPFIAPFPQIYDLDARFRHCTVVRYEGVYPAHKLEPAKGPTLPDKNVRFGPKRFGSNRGKDEEETKDEENEKEEEKDKRDQQQDEKENTNPDEDGDGGRRPGRSRLHQLIRSPENAHHVPQAPKETNLNAHQLRRSG
ncbi:MAG: hypothetical protein Q9184_006314 [Pyrenodesmia sp. 2 TL-2023]